jgi:hypothetical protein
VASEEISLILWDRQMTMGYTIKNVMINQSLYYPTNAHNVKNLDLLKHIKLLWRLLQHVSVYKETIIREPQPVLS